MTPATKPPLSQNARGVHAIWPSLGASLAWHVSPPEPGAPGCLQRVGVECWRNTHGLHIHLWSEKCCSTAAECGFAWKLLWVGQPTGTWPSEACLHCVSNGCADNTKPSATSYNRVRAWPPRKRLLHTPTHSIPTSRAPTSTRKVDMHQSPVPRHPRVSELSSTTKSSMKPHKIRMHMPHRLQHVAASRRHLAAPTLMLEGLGAVQRLPVPH